MGPYRSPSGDLGALVTGFQSDRGQVFAGDRTTNTIVLENGRELVATHLLEDVGELGARIERALEERRQSRGGA